MNRLILTIIGRGFSTRREVCVSLRLAPLLALALIAAGCVNWPMFRHDPQHSGDSTLNTGTVKGVLKWKFSFPKGCNIVSSPAVDNNERVYIGAVCNSGGSPTGAFCAVNPDGTSAWCSINMQGYPLYSSAALGADVYIGGFNSGTLGLLAIDSSSGNPAWTFPAKALLSPPTVSVALPNGTGSLETTIYVGTIDGKLYAVNPNGTEKWHLVLGTPEMAGAVVSSSPAVARDGTIYVGLNNPGLVGEVPTGGLEAVNPNGTEKWIFSSGGVDSSASVGGDGTIYFGSYDQFFYAVNPNGTAKWSLADVGAVVSSPAFGQGGGAIYFGSRNKRVYAVTPGALVLWTFLTGGAVDSSPAVSSDGTIFVGSGDHYLYALNSNGKVKWKFLTGGPVRSSPAIGEFGTTVYVGSDDGSLYAIH
jgi:outer membrane protein assembly factor BamB